MKTRTAITSAALALAIGVPASAALASSTSATTTRWQPETSATTISSAVADDLAFSREEERMARDLYALIADTYDGARPFSMITNSEQRHYDAIGTLLTRYNIADPAAGLAPGTYADPAIQQLYDDWKAQALSSLDAAYDVGVALEKRDIADLEEQQSVANLPADVARVYANLLAGSEHHLAAFTSAADGTGVTGANGGGGKGPGSINHPMGMGTNGAGNGQARGNRSAIGNGQGSSQGNSNRQGGGPGMGHTRGGGQQGNGSGTGDCPNAS